MHVLRNKHDIMHIENEIVEEHGNSSRNERLGDGEQLETIINSTDPSQIHPSGDDSCREIDLAGNIFQILMRISSWIKRKLQKNWVNPEYAIELVIRIEI